MAKAKAVTKATKKETKKETEKKKAAPAPKTKAIKKTPASDKKAASSSAAKALPKPAASKSPVAPKKGAKSTKDSASKSLDLCLILDCTASMHSWIQRSKDTLHQIIDHVKNENEGLTVRVAFVAYRDYSEGGMRFDVTDFTSDIDAVK